MRFDLEFFYDAWNNLVKVRSAFDADVTVATYAFFADDRRASRTVTNRGGLNGVTYYFYDGHEVIEERDGSGAVVQQYLFGPQHIDELLLTLGENGANWVHQDANWNVIGTTTSTGQVAERYTYDPYGRLRARRLTGFGDTDADGLVGTKDVEDWEDTQGEHGVYDRKLDANLDGVNDAYDAAAFDKMVSLPGGRLTVPNRRFSPSEQWAGYTARTLDPESGLMHYRLRVYSPELRRFGQRDPLGYAASGPMLYEYTSSSPCNRRDPLGLEDTACAAAGKALSEAYNKEQEDCGPKLSEARRDYTECCDSKGYVMRVDFSLSVLCDGACRQEFLAYQAANKACYDARDFYKKAAVVAWKCGKLAFKLLRAVLDPKGAKTVKEVYDTIEQLSTKCDEETTEPPGKSDGDKPPADSKPKKGKTGSGESSGGGATAGEDKPKDPPVKGGRKPRKPRGGTGQPPPTGPHP